MKLRLRCLFIDKRVVLLSLLMVAVSPGRATAQSSLKVPQEAVDALEKVNAGDPAAALPIAKSLEQSQPQSPLGYVVEADALWSTMYCTACEIKWGMVDDWKRSKSERKNPEGVNEDDAYLSVTDKAIELAGAGIARADNASDHLYAGMAYAQKANLFGLRGENRAVARAAVSARAEFIRAIELDPQMADATAGLGLYNYYVDSLSAAVKVLRFFMGIPGGSKEEGLKQLETGMANGVLMKVTARFYLSKNLRNFDYQYARAAAYLAPLVTQYPQNPTFAMLMANLEIEQGRSADAVTRLRAIQSMAIPNPECAAKTKKLAAEFLSSIHQ